MGSDVLNKPKQFKEFREYREVLMNCPSNYEYSEDWESIYTVAGLPNPGVAPPSTIEKKK